MGVADLVFDDSRIQRKVFAARIVRAREVNRPLAVPCLPALSHQVSKNQEHRAILEPIQAFMRQPVTPGQFPGHGIPL